MQMIKNVIKEIKKNKTKPEEDIEATSLKYLNNILNYYCKTDFSAIYLENRDKIRDTFSKMNKIKRAYLSDKDTFAVLLFKYEETFRVASEFISKSESLNRGSQKEIITKVSELIEYPYEEIFEIKANGWLYKDIDNELKILSDLKKSLNKIN